MWNVLHPLPRMLHGNATDFALGIHVQQGVFIEIARFGHRRRSKLDVERVGVLKILNLHG